MKQPLFFGFVIVFLTIFTVDAYSQKESIKPETPDSILEKQHSPTKATIMSACLPGLGQIYNKKVWKVPIIYAGFGVMAYFIYTNADEYLNYKCAFIESSYGNMNGSYGYLVQKYTKDELLSAREYYRRNLEISCLISAVWYALNILDATVDAHLFTYNISDNLTLKIEPSFQATGFSPKPASGLSFSLHF
ncbi:MAG: DUF5683 domain-containing protein [Bacteroidales bacterium]|nr:DUF5683 domain-containing protein [Bacteroidales bacterium]MDD4603086.1 DUF5683 domain-containing protein [Bacteroidales bacterium]